MRHIVLVMVVFWYSLVPTQLFGLGKVPPLPADPYGEEAFKTIKAFYGLKKGLPRFSVASIESENHTHYRLQTVRLQIDNYPNISLTLKIPNQFRPPVSALVLFTGFQTGSDSIHLVGDPQDSVYVAFQYPWPILHKEGTIRWDWSQMQMIPVLMSVGLAWLHQQPFINKEKINVATVSFGTLFYPLAQRLLNEQ